MLVIALQELKRIQRRILEQTNSTYAIIQLYIGEKSDHLAAFFQFLLYEFANLLHNAIQLQLNETVSYNRPKAVRFSDFTIQQLRCAGEKAPLTGKMFILSIIFLSSLDCLITRSSSSQVLTVFVSVQLVLSGLR